MTSVSAAGNILVFFVCFVDLRVFVMKLLFSKRIGS